MPHTALPTVRVGPCELGGGQVLRMLSDGSCETWDRATRLWYPNVDPRHALELLSAQAPPLTIAELRAWGLARASGGPVAPGVRLYGEHRLVRARPGGGLERWSWGLYAWLETAPGHARPRPGERVRRVALDVLAAWGVPAGSPTARGASVEGHEQR